MSDGDAPAPIGGARVQRLASITNRAPEAPSSAAVSVSTDSMPVTLECGSPRASALTIANGRVATLEWQEAGQETAIEEAQVA